MDFYSLPIIINDRREKIINLYHQKDDITVFKYIVEAHRNAHFNIAELQADSILKSFIPQHPDLDIKDCIVHCTLESDTLRLHISPRQKQPLYEAPEPEQEAPEPPPVYSYEDLELFKSAPKKEKITAQNTVEAIQSDSEIIGVWQDTIKLIRHRYSNGATLVTGYITGAFNKLLDAAFPDLTLELVLETEGQQFSNKTTISFAHPEQFLGIALDFGSEASQMAIKRYQYGEHHQQMRPEIENLFKNILAFNKSQGWISKEEQASYYQEEKNTNFYKSIFFLKENQSGQYDNIYKDLFIADVAHNLKMLVNTHDGYQVLTQNKYHQLPNLKITQKYDSLFSGINFNIDKDGYDINVSLGVMKNKVYNTILKVMIESFLKKEFLISYDATRKIRFILLVPNIYDFYDIKSTQQILHNIFQSLADHEYKGKLLSWEIITISESDASFLGYINKNDTHIDKNREYIIIDSGKGTTDLSIIRTGARNVFDIKTVYRNGFAGAGNLITFAVFETILHYIRANASNQHEAFKFIKEKIINVLNSNDLELKNNIFAQIERLKFKYTDNSRYVLSQWQQASVGDTTFRNLTEEGRADITSTFRNLLAGIENISDFYGYITETCKVIATRVVQNIRLVKKNAEQFNCGGVILSGRAFLFRPLEEQVRKQLEEELDIPASRIHLLNGNELKDICIKGVFNNSVRLNAEKIGYPIQVISRSKSPVSEPEPSQAATPGKPKMSIQSRLLKIFFNELNDLENVEAVIPTTHTSLQYDSLANSQILIGGKRYKIVGNSIYNQQSGIREEANLMFTEKGYLVRKLENGIVRNIIELQEIFDTEDIELNMVIPSLFPNYIDEEFIHTFQKAIDLSPAPPTPPAGGPMYFDIQPPADNKSSNSNNNNNSSGNSGPLYF